MAAYEAFQAGTIQDYDYPKELIDKALEDLPKITFKNIVWADYI